MSDGTHNKREVVRGYFGYAYRSNNGNVVIDRHRSDQEHLLSPQTNDTQPLYNCRTYLNDVLPNDWMDKFGLFIVSHVINSEGDVTAVQIMFTPHEPSVVVQSP